MAEAGANTLLAEPTVAGVLTAAPDMTSIVLDGSAAVTLFGANSVIGTAAGLTYIASGVASVTAAVALAGGTNYVDVTARTNFHVATGNGADTLLANDSGDISAGGGTNLIRVAGNAPGATTVTSTGFNDRIEFQTGSNIARVQGTGVATIIGGAPTLSGGGVSAITGTAGTSTYYADASSTSGGAVLVAESGAVTLNASGAKVAVQLIGGAADARLIGGAGGDTLQAGTGNSYLVGGADADTLYGGVGADTLLGGNGDVLYGGTGPGRYIINPGAGGSATVIAATGSANSVTVASDAVYFLGYNSTQSAASLQNHATTGAGGVTLTLSDNTAVTFSSLTSASQLTGHILYVGGAPCFFEGTAVLTERGEVAVEDLAIGDMLITHSLPDGHSARPLRWIGRRCYDGRFAAGNRDVLPVCICAGALAENLPRRDLWVLPLHAMYLDGALIPAAALVNGISILQAEAVERVAYYHLELDRHAVILAEGAPSESFVDDDSRGMFQNAAEFYALYPDVQRVRAQYCAPRVEQGEILEAQRLLLTARAGLEARAEAVPGQLTGNLEQVDHAFVEGWACDMGGPDTPVRLLILAGETLLDEVFANRFRGDLLKAGIGRGRHGFRFALPAAASCADQNIHVRRAVEGQDIPGSPSVCAEVSQAA